MITKPCVRCELPVDAEIFEEELGFCVDCSHLYWDQKLDPITLEKLS
jgi:sugar phosphate isomerase/epimerase